MITETRDIKHRICASDGSIIPVTFIEGNNLNSPVVIMVPGLGVSADFYRWFTRKLNNYGYHIVLSELRGQGMSTPAPSASSRYGYHTLASEDIPALVNLATQRYPSSSIYLVGHSIGGQICALYSSRPGSNVSGLIFLASGVPYIPDYGITAPRIIAAVYGLCAALLLKRYKPATIFENFGPQSRTLMRDWIKLCLRGKFSVIDADVNYERRLSEMSLPVLTLSFSGDVDAPKATVRRLIQKIPRCVVDHHHVKSNPSLGHNGWMSRPILPAAYVHKWIEKQESFTARDIA